MGSLRRKRRNGAGRADRITAGLAVLAVATAGTVLVGELASLARRRIMRRERGAEHHGATTPIELAGNVTQDAVAIAREGYGTATKQEAVLFNLLSGFAGAFAIARLSTTGIRQGWWPLGNVVVAGRHIHHFVPGVLLAFGAGAGALLSSSERAEQLLAVPFGAGIGLTFDEAALLLDLRDVYWTREGLLSVQVSLGLAVVLGGTIMALRIIRRGEDRVVAAGAMPDRHGDMLAVAGGAASAAI